MKPTRIHRSHTMPPRLSDRERLLQLQRQLEEATREKEEATKREQEATKREQEATKREQEATKREQEATKREQEATRETTLHEFLHYCHIYLSKPLSVQSDKSKSTGGGTTRTYGKYYPTKLRHWDDFLQSQQGYFNNICHVFQPSWQRAFRRFERRTYYEDLCKNV